MPSSSLPFVTQLATRAEASTRKQVGPAEHHVLLSGDIAAAIRLEVSRQIAIQVKALALLGTEQLRKALIEVE